MDRKGRRLGWIAQGYIVEGYILGAVLDGQKGVRLGWKYKANNSTRGKSRLTEICGRV